MVKASPPSVEPPRAPLASPLRPAPRFGLSHARCTFRALPILSGALGALPPLSRALRALHPSSVALALGGLPLSVTLALGTLAGCGSSSDLGMVGFSDRPPSAPRSPPLSSATPTASSWANVQAFSSLAPVDDRLLPSLGHNPPLWSGVVHVSAGLESSYQTLGSSHEPWPEGSLIVERHTKPDGLPGPAYAMRKLGPGSRPDAGDWGYAVLSSDGAFQDAGDLSFCARCHADAPHQFLFGPRSDARRRLHGEAPSLHGAPPGDSSLSDEASAPPEDASPPSKTPARPPKR